MSEGPVPLLLAVDGDSLLHRAHHAHHAHHSLTGGEERDAAGRPVWALRGLLSLVAAAAARLQPDALVVGFDCRADSVRKADYPLYKAHRGDKPPDLHDQLEAAPGLLAAAGMCVVVRRGYEADDVLASAAALARRHRWRSALLTSDRDAFALVDDATSVLRLVNGGVDGSPLITPRALRAAYGVAPAQYLDYASLRGDVSDNLPGVSGIGGTLAARLLATFGTADDAFTALDAGHVDRVSAIVGGAAAANLAGVDARETVVRNRRLMTMRTDLTLPELAAMRLPLDGERVRSVLLARQIRLGPSLWALLGETAPGWLGLGGYDRAPSYLPGVTEMPTDSAGTPLRPDWRAASARLASARPLDPDRTAEPPRHRRGPRRGLPRPVPVGQLTLF